MSLRIAVKPEQLRWACERSGRDLDVLTKRFGKLPLWLSGRAQPTLKQLEELAKAIYTRFGYFFLPAAIPPKQPTKRWCHEVATELIAPLTKLVEDERCDVEPRDTQLRNSRRFARALIADTLEGNTSYRDAFYMLGITRESAFGKLSAQLGYRT